MFLDNSLKNEHNYRITDVFKKTDKLSVLLRYKQVHLQHSILRNDADILQKSCS